MLGCWERGKSPELPWNPLFPRFPWNPLCPFLLVYWAISPLPVLWVQGSVRPSERLGPPPVSNLSNPQGQLNICSVMDGAYSTTFFFILQVPNFSQMIYIYSTARDESLIKLQYILQDVLTLNATYYMTSQVLINECLLPVSKQFCPSMFLQYSSINTHHIVKPKWKQVLKN